MTTIEDVQAAPEALVFTPRELAQALKCSERWVYQALREGKIPSIRIGRKILIGRRVVEDFLAANQS